MNDFQGSNGRGEVRGRGRSKGRGRAKGYGAGLRVGVMGKG